MDAPKLEAVYGRKTMLSCYATPSRIEELRYNLYAMKKALVVMIDDEMEMVVTHSVPCELTYYEMVERAHKETSFYPSRVLIIENDKDGPKVVYDEYASEEEE